MKKENILKKLKNKNIDIILLDLVDSTNDYLKQLAKQGVQENTVVIANSQTQGKGTRQRKFFSKPGGVYLSILLKPCLMGFDATLITSMTAVAVSDSINQISGKSSKIKWVNDVYLENKKVSGILCESVFDPETQEQNIIVGIGVNLFMPDGGFESEIKDIATCVLQDYNSEIMEDFISLILNNFYEYYNDIKSKTHLEKYRERSLVLGKEITVFQNNVTSTATALEIDDNCRLVVEFSDETRKVLSSGDVTIKL